MKKPVAKHLIEESLGRLAQQRADIVPGGDQRRAVIHPDAADAIGRQHAASGALPIDARHTECRIASEILGELRCRRRLEPQIHFDLDRLGEGAGDLNRL